MIYFLLKCFCSSKHLLQIKFYRVRTSEVIDPEQKEVGLVRGPTKETSEVRSCPGRKGTSSRLGICSCTRLLWSVDKSSPCPRRKRVEIRVKKKNHCWLFKVINQLPVLLWLKIDIIKHINLFKIRCASSGKIVPKGAARWRWDTLR